MSGDADFVELLSPHVEAGAVASLTRYAELVERWSGRHNLVRFSSREELVERHILEALAALPYCGDRGRLLDIGSGAGLPGVPLLVMRPGWVGVLLEPRHKRAAFLRTVVRELGLSATVDRRRYQDYRGDSVFDLMTARAVGGYEDLLRWARPRLTPTGRLLIWTTRDRLTDFEGTPGWRVLSSQLPGLDCGRLARLQPCST